MNPGKGPPTSWMSLRVIERHPARFIWLACLVLSGCITGRTDSPAAGLARPGDRATTKGTEIPAPTTGDDESDIRLASVSERRAVTKTLMESQRDGRPNQSVAGYYLVGCHDVLRLQIASHPHLNGNYRIGPDGRIQISQEVAVRVEGHTPAEIEERVADALGTSPKDVVVEVVQYESQYVILFGQVGGWQRVLSYRGQETVLDLLERSGITAGASPESIYIVRSHIENGQRPEVFHIDLSAIVAKKDERTNIRIHPYDQIYVGETRRSRLERIFPPWMRPFQHALLNVPPEKRADKMVGSDR